MKLEQGEASFDASKWKKHCMYRVPGCLRGRSNDNDFGPHLVSIGPYHSADRRLQSMQFHKARMLDCILKRTRNDKNVFYDAIKYVEHEARACYEDLADQTSFPSEDFMNMLVLDGCFMLEFLEGFCQERHCELGYDKEDPIFSKEYMCYGILMDMMLIENQIPLFILDQLYEVQFGNTQKNKVTDLVFEAFNPKWVIGRVPKSENGEKRILSSLQLEDTGRNMPRSCLEAFWQSLMYDCIGDERSRNRDSMPMGGEPRMAIADRDPGSQNRDSMPMRGEPRMAIAEQDPERRNRDSMPMTPKPSMGQVERDPGWQTQDSMPMIPIPVMAPAERDPGMDEPMIIMDLEQHVVRSVIALKEAGVTFKHKNTPPFWDVKFDSKSGVLEIPQIIIAEWSKSMYLNLMAFELRNIKEGDQKILSYILFMDSLINSAADVDVLRACGAIVSTGMSDKEIADVFNDLGRYPIIITSSNQDLTKQIYKYCSKRIHRWRANLMHNYFHNPWAIISVIAAGFLMLLTIVQTFYTIAPYYKNP